MQDSATPGTMLSAVYDALAGPGTRLWPVWLLLAVLIAYALYRRRRVEGSFLAWAFPRQVYFHASHLVDIKLFLVGRAMAMLGVFNSVVFSSAVALWVAGAFPAGGLGLAPPHPVLVALILLMVGDFAVYWVHRLHHETRALWPFHSLHHSAEVMTPVTVYRKHPVYDLISSFVRGILLGTLQGVFLGLFAGEVGYLMVLGVNAGYVLFNAAGSNLRHTHIWFSYGPLLERIFISPAQHQIHHSSAVEHHDCNYGEVLAIWDWMFGTLYVPEAEERLQFGLADAEGRPLPQRHGTLSAALMVPLRDFAEVLGAALRRNPAARAQDEAAPPERVTPAE